MIDYINEHLSEDLALDQLARVAYFSPFHFHRVFKSLTNENLFEYVQRLRMERAGSALKRSGPSILEVALNCGFSGAATFARAFKAYFGMNATEWRNGGAERWKEYRNFGKQLRSRGKARRRGKCHSNPRYARARWREPREAMTMTTKIKELPRYHVAYMRNVGPYGPHGIPETWNRMEKWMSAHGISLDDSLKIGISHDDPQVTTAEKCRYDACVVVPRDFAGDAVVNVTDIPGGKYVIAEFVGTSRDIVSAWNSTFRNALPGTGFQPDNRPCFELYAGDCHVNAKRGVFRCELCLPVRPL